jgi:hypothetical protein
MLVTGKLGCTFSATSKVPATLVSSSMVNLAKSHEGHDSLVTRTLTGLVTLTPDAQPLATSSPSATVPSPGSPNPNLQWLLQVLKRNTWQTTLPLLKLSGSLLDLHHKQVKPTIMFSDNQAAIALSNNHEAHQCTKHIDTKYHFVRERVEDGSVTIKFLPTNQQPADILTKPTGKNLM